MDDTDEQAYWMHLLGDAVSYTVPPRMDSSVEAQEESLSQYLLLHVEHDPQHSDAQWVVGNEVHEEMRETQGIDESVNVRESVIETPQHTFAQAPSMDLDRLSLLRKHTHTRTQRYVAPDTDVWADEAPLAPLPPFVFPTHSHTLSHTHSHTQDEDAVERETESQIDTESDTVASQNALTQPLAVCEERQRESESFRVSVPHTLSVSLSLPHSASQSIHTLSHTLADALSTLCHIATQRVGERVRERVSESVVWRALSDSALSLSLTLTDSLSLTTQALSSHSLSQRLVRAHIAHTQREALEERHRERLREASSWRDVWRRVQLGSLSHRDRQLVWLTHEPSEGDDGRTDEELRSTVRHCLSELSAVEDAVRDGRSLCLSISRSLSRAADEDDELCADDELHFTIARHCTAPAALTHHTTLTHNHHNNTSHTLSHTQHTLTSHTHTTHNTQCCVCGHTPSLVSALSVRLCARCGLSVCVQHATQTRGIPQFGIPTGESVRVCDMCARTLDAQFRWERERWRAARVSDYVERRLLPYVSVDKESETDEQRWAKTEEYGSQSQSLTFSLPALEDIQRLGLLGLRGFLPHTITERERCVAIVRDILTQDKVMRLSSDELTSRLENAFTAAQAERGDDNEREHREYSHCCELREDEIELALRYAPLALNTVFLSSCVAMQRQSSLRGLRLLFSNCEDPTQTTQADSMCEGVVYALFVPDYEREDVTDREAVLVIRGDISDSLTSLTTDTHTPLRSFPPSLTHIAECLSLSPTVCLTHLPEEVRERWERERQHTQCTQRVAQRALCVLRETGPALLSLAQRGVSLSLVGHGQGGAVAACLSLCFSPFLSLSLSPTHTHSHTHSLSPSHSQAHTLSHTQTADVEKTERHFRVFAFSPPPCLDAHTAETLRAACVRSIAVGDAACVRLSPTVTRRLARELMRPQSAVSQQEGAAKEEDVTEGVVSCEKERPSQSSDCCEDAELPSLSLPGTVWRLYQHRGVWRAVESDSHAVWDSLRRLELHYTLSEHHRPQCVLQALLEARAVLRAPRSPTPWQSFSSAHSCACCKDSFETVSHTSQALPSTQRVEKRNCAHCGKVVCGRCSTQQRAIPKYGVLFPRPVCDVCVMNGDYAVLK